MTPEIEYGNNLIRNPSAESNLTHWTSNGVTVIAGGVEGAKCFRLSSDATLRQSEEYLAFVVAPATFKVKIHHKHTAAQGTLYANIRSFCTLRITYEDSTVPNSTYILPLNSQGTVGKWLTSEMECDIQIDSIVKGYTLVVNNVGGDADLQIDSIELRSGVDGLSAHNATEHPHNLPLAIGVGSYGIKATKGDEIQFWLTDEGDAIFKGEISAAQITVGKILDSQVDIENFNLLRNPTFSTYAENLSTVSGTVTGQATLIQQNSEAITSQATDFGSRITVLEDDFGEEIGLLHTKFENYSTIDQTATSISAAVTSVETQISSVNSKVNGVASTVATHSTDINVLATGLSSKVESTDFTGTNIVSLIEQTSSEIKLSAEKIHLDGITNVNKTLRIGEPSDRGTIIFATGASLYAGGGTLEARLNVSASDFEIEARTNFYQDVYFAAGVNVTGLSIYFN